MFLQLSAWGLPGWGAAGLQLGAGGQEGSPEGLCDSAGASLRALRPGLT